MICINPQGDFVRTAEEAVEAAWRVPAPSANGTVCGGRKGRREVRGLGDLAPAVTVPPHPTRPTVVSATTTMLTIEWTHPGDGGSPLLRNYLEYRMEHALDWMNVDVGTTPVTRATIGGPTRARTWPRPRPP